MSEIEGLTGANIAAAEAAVSSRARSAWYVEAFLAFGGWVAGLVAAAAIFALAFAILGDVESGDGIAVFGLAVGALFAGTGAAIGGPGKGSFIRHFSVAAVAAGLTAATGGAWWLAYSAIEKAAPGLADAKQLGAAGLFAAAMLLVAGAVIARRLQDAILTFLVTLAIYGVASVAANLWLSGDYFYAAFFDPITPVAVLAGLILFTRPIGRQVYAAVGAALMIGPMILYDLFHYQLRMVGIDGVGEANFVAITFWSRGLIIAGIIYALAMMRGRFAPLPLAAGGALLIAGAWALPLSGAIAILVILAGMAGAHAGLAALGVVALAGFIARFYHDLSMTLLEKSALMGALGAATLAGALIFARMRRLAHDPSPAAPHRRGALTMLGFAAVMLGAFAIINQSVWRLEADFRDSRTVLLPLAPVDPRSLIQGDYMVLNFAQTIYPDREYLDRDTKEGQVYLRLDENNVAAFSRMAPPVDFPEANEVLVNYRMTPYGDIRYCPESFFFQEGDADAFATARYAVLKVAPSGKTRLVDLADENFTIIDPEERAAPPRG